jgi:hypothetical protein
MAAVLLIAAFFRLWRLDSVPRGLSHDEANNGLMATQVLEGFRPVYFEIYTGVEPGLIYPHALAFWLLGPGDTTARLVSVAAGLLTVALTYAFAQQLFQSRLVGLLSALLVALSFWHIFVSRLALRAVIMPPLQILNLLFLWRGLEGGRRRDFLFAGLFGGLTMYTYLSSRFLPFVMIAFVLYLLIRQVKLGGRWTNLGLMVLVWVLVFLPLGLYFLQNPEWFLFRANQALILAQPEGGGGLPALAQQTLATLGMFSFEGDASWRYNLAGRPVFDWGMALFYYAGLVLSLVRGVREPKLNPYAYLLIVQVVMLLPDFLTDGSPHFLRTIGAIPATFIFAALAMEALYRWVRPRWRWALVAILWAWGVFAGLSTYRDYFHVWAHHPHARWDYNASFAEIADHLQQNGSRALIASTRPDLDRLAFDLAAGGEPLPARWFHGNQALVYPVAHQSETRYYLPVTVPMPDQLRALLPDDGAEQLLAPDGSLSVEILQLPSAAPNPQQRLEFLLGDQVLIAGYDLLSPEVQAGELLDLLLHWRIVSNPDPRRQWTWFMHLVDSRGYRWANWSDQGFEVADWRPGDYIVQHVSLEVPFDAPDVAYHLEIGVFDRGSEERLLAANGADHLLVEGVRVLPADPDSVAGIIAEHQRGQLGEELVYLGTTFGAKKVKPGSEVLVTLAWAPIAPLVEDHPFHLQLVAADDQVVHEVDWVPFEGEYQTSSWPAGRIVRDVLELTIPEDAAPGRVQLVVSAQGLEGSVQAGRLQIVP